MQVTNNHLTHERPATRARFPVLFALAAALLIGATGGGGLTPRAAYAQQRAKPVEFSAGLSRPVVRAGEAVDVVVMAKVSPPYHIYSVNPVPPPGPQETKVTVEGAGITPVGGNREPAPKVVDDPNFGQKIGMHEGAVAFRQTISVAKDAKPGPLPLAVSVRYMACTESSCLPPKTVKLEVPELTVEAGAPRSEFVAPAAPAAGEGAAPATAAAAEPVTSGPTKWTATPGDATVRPGEAVAISVRAEIDAPYHIYSITPVPPPGPQETKFTVEGEGVSVAGEAKEPAPKVVDDANFGKAIGMHEGAPVFTQVVQIGKDVAPGTLTFTLKARYMACTESACLPPKTVKLPVTLTVEAGEPRADRTPDALLAAAGGSGDTATPTAPPTSGGEAAAPTSSSSGSEDGLGTFLLAAFGAGLLALVTPCVFPMIPVTLAFFTKQAAAKDGEAQRGSIVKLAAVYSLGIIVAFTGIGAIMAATVGAAGANRLAANPWVNLVFAVLFVIFALALLEVFELQPPAALRNLTAKNRSVGGTLGVLGMGLTFVIAAFTCTAPFIGTVLVAAASATSGAQWIRPILGMTVFATALALPFFVLSLFPSLLAKMPRSGAWLSTVKGAMGFLELAAALKFLSNADLVWQWKVLTQPVLLAAWAAIAFAAAFWLAGVLKIGLGAPEGKLTYSRGAWTALFAAAGLYCLYGLTGRPVNALVASILPPPEYGYGAKTEDLEWHPTLEEGIARAKAENKPIFVDFTGYTCTNCRWVEQNVFTQPAVRALLKEKYVLVRLITDDPLTAPGGDTTLGEVRQAYQEKAFGTIALPLYAVLTPEGTPVRHGDVEFFGGTRSPQAFGQNFAAFLSKDATPSDTVARN
jgi:Thiol:disulfide interchange protein